jgi:hypothetical protein
LLIAEVIRGDGSRQGVHYWNLLPDGTELDLTREQFGHDEVVQQPRMLQRPAGLPKPVRRTVSDDAASRLRCARHYRGRRHELPVDDRTCRAGIDSGVIRRA